MRDVVIFCDRAGYYGFLKPYIDSFAGDSRFNFIIERDPNRERFSAYLERECTIWIDGLSDFAVWASFQPNTSKAKLVCRLVGTDILDISNRSCLWEAFDGIVFSNKSSEAVALDCFDRLDSMAECFYLPPAVSITPSNVKNKSYAKKIAYVGPLGSSGNAIALLYFLSDLVKRDRDYRLFVIGEFESTSFQLHFEHLIGRLNLAGNIEFHQQPESMPVWFADKSYILSTTTTAGNEAAIVEAQSLGVQPIVLDYFGGESIFPADVIAASIEQAVSAAVRSTISPEILRQYALENHNVLMHRSRFSEILQGPDDTYLPKVSILVPTFNRAEMLRNTLTQLNKQTYTNREIVVVNDCSKDDTEAVIKELQKTRDDIVYFRNNVNQGNASTMAIAAANATGEFVMVLSDDDGLDPTALEKFVAAWRRKKSDVIYSDLVVVDAEGKEQSRWQYKNYYSNYQLLSELVLADGNRIPETFFCRRDQYEQVYTQTYARRFLNTYYLPLLRSLKMHYIPEGLYRYTVHAGSTFSNAVGLFDRSKSTQNYINAAMFMYSPPRIMNVPLIDSPGAQIANSYLSLAQLLIEHGKNRIAGAMYTGAEYSAKDNLHWVYYYNAYHWTMMARRYGASDTLCNGLISKIQEVIDPAEFSPRIHANLPEIYERLPWFAHKAFNNLKHFIALDIATIGAPDWLSKRTYRILDDGPACVEVCNHICKTMEDLQRVMGQYPITVVNIFDAGAIEPVVRFLAENQLPSVFICNFSRIRIPDIEVLRTVFNIGPKPLAGFDEYLDLVTDLTTSNSYEYTTLQTTV